MGFFPFFAGICVNTRLNSSLARFAFFMKHEFLNLYFDISIF